MDEQQRILHELKIKCHELKNAEKPFVQSAKKEKLPFVKTYKIIKMANFRLDKAYLLCYNEFTEMSQKCHKKMNEKGE